MDYTPQIWKWFKTNTKLTDEAIAGIMGNLYCESNCEPCRKQGDFSEERTLSKQYAAEVDSGNLQNFISGKYGWGLAQWTYWSRCKELAEYCKSKGTSIADLNSQLEFLMKELQRDFNPLYRNCLNVKSIEIISDQFCEQYENPYIKNYVPRRNQAKGFYTRFSGKAEEPVEVVDNSERIATLVRRIQELSSMRNSMNNLIAECESELMRLRNNE